MKQGGSIVGSSRMPPLLRNFDAWPLGSDARRPPSIRKSHCADGLVEAFRALSRDDGLTLDDADYRLTDCNGEQYGFKADRLAIARTVRKLKNRFDHLHPADCIGEVGAAVVPCAVGLALAAARKGYAVGDGVLCHFSNDDRRPGRHDSSVC